MNKKEEIIACENKETIFKQHCGNGGVLSGFFLRSYRRCDTLCSGEAGVLVCFSSKKITKNSLLTGWTSAMIYSYFCAFSEVKDIVWHDDIEIMKETRRR